jgi:hypothetical protein
VDVLIENKEVLSLLGLSFLLQSKGSLFTNNISVLVLFGIKILLLLATSYWFYRESRLFRLRLALLRARAVLLLRLILALATLLFLV